LDWAQHSTNSLVKDVLQSLLGQGGALEVTNSRDLLGHLESLRVCDGRHAPLTKLVNGLLIVTQVQLGTNEDGRDIRGMMADLWIPLLIAAKEQRQFG